jgi:hypothetical protein
MGSPIVAAALAKAFEPILYFHKDEHFFPIDPKWYLERCALWKTTRPFDDKANWQQPPLIAKGSLAALDGPKEIAGGKTWIGTPGADFGVAPERPGEQPADEEHFLEFVGWDPVSTPPVGPGTQNRHAALQAGDYIAPLQGSEPWYYVEYLDNADLLGYADNPNIKSNGLNLFSIVANNPKLNAPRILLYHLLYPLHNETLEGCEDAGEGRLFGSYAGEWACIAIVIDAADKPLFVGLTSRNTGSPSTIAGEEHRVGMTIHPWSDLQTVADAAGAHPKIFVSLDTHGHYPAPGVQTLTPFTPSGLDISRMSCGEAEKLDDALSSEVVVTPGEPEEGAKAGIIILKFLVAFGTAGIGILWGTSEDIWGKFGSEDVLASPTPQPTDVTGGPDFGVVLRPKGLALPEAPQIAKMTDWNVRSHTAPAPDGRAYNFVVSRASQMWWSPRPTPRAGTKDLKNPNGFSGRWGPRVTNDPNSRRAGMKCPDFALLAMVALAVKLNT